MRIAILGAGITGLSAAYYFKKKYGKSAEIALFEKNPSAGGWISTDGEGGWLFEKGPRSLRTHGNGRFALELAEELGLESDVIAASKNANTRYLLKDGRLQKLPKSLIGAFFNPYGRLALKALLKDAVFHQQKSIEDESIADFCRARFGHQVLEDLFDPMVSGIYAGDPEKLSLECCFPDLFTLKKTGISYLRHLLTRKNTPQASSEFVKKMGQHPIFSFRKGLFQLAQALSIKLKDELHLQTEVCSIDYVENKWELSVQTGERLAGFDRLVNTLPLPVLKSLFLPLETLNVPELSYATVAAIHLGFEKEPHLNKRLDGFGYLVSKSQSESILGVVFDSSVFPEQSRFQNEVRMSVMIGGMRDPEMLEKTDQELCDIALEAVKRHLQVSKRPDVMRISRSDRAIAQYPVGFKLKLKIFLEKVKGRFPSLTLLGTAFHGVSVGDCIAAGKSCVTEVDEKLQK